MSLQVTASDGLRLPSIKSLNFSHKPEDHSLKRRPAGDDDLELERERERENRLHNNPHHPYYQEHPHPHSHPQHHQQPQPQPTPPFTFQTYQPSYPAPQDTTYIPPHPQHEYHNTSYPYQQQQYQVSDFPNYPHTSISTVVRNPYQHHSAEHTSPQSSQQYYSPISPRGQPPSPHQPPPSWVDSTSPEHLPQHHIHSAQAFEHSLQHYPPPVELPVDHNRKPANISSAPVTTTNTEASTAPVTIETSDPDSAKRSFITTIIEHCNAIYTFASRYASLTNSTPPNSANFDPARNRNPPPSEVREMTQRAQLVLDLVERIRGAKGTMDPRTWEWASTDSKRARFKESSFSNQNHSGNALQSPRGLMGTGSYMYDDLDPESRSEAERDMLTIRSKRSAAAAVAAANANANSGGNNNGQLSGVPGPGGDKLAKKSRKRGRTPLPGKCHSCNIRETPEWRRGPDGARTLCNACGLHYAKLVRKRDKALMSTSIAPTEIETRPVDMEMVRASTQKSGGQLYCNSDAESKSQLVQQFSPTVPQNSQRMDADPIAGTNDVYARSNHGSLSHNDGYQLSNAAYSISTYSTLTPQRVPPSPQRHTGNDQQIASWNNNSPTDGHYIRDFRSNARDERR